MTNYRIFLLCFLAVSWLFLSGLNKPVDGDISVIDRHKTDVEQESFPTERDRKQLETKRAKAKSDVKPVKSSQQDKQQTTTKITDAVVANENNPIERKELEKPLDLSVPFNDADKADLKVGLKSDEQGQEAGVFDPQTQKKPRSLELNGDLVMSPEPEAEKRKSVDGAGIVINLKP